MYTILNIVIALFVLVPPSASERKPIYYPFGAVKPTEGGGTAIQSGVGAGGSGVGSQLTFGSPQNPGVSSSMGVQGEDEKYGIGSNIGWGDGLTWGSGVQAGKDGRGKKQTRKATIGTGGNLSLGKKPGISGGSGVSADGKNYGIGSSVGWNQQGLQWGGGVQAGKQERQDEKSLRRPEKAAIGTGGQVALGNPSNFGVSGGSGISSGDQQLGIGSSVGMNQGNLQWGSAAQAGKTTSQVGKGSKKKAAIGTGGQLSTNANGAGISGGSGVSANGQQAGIGSSIGMNQGGLQWGSGAQAGRNDMDKTDEAFGKHKKVQSTLGKKNKKDEKKGKNFSRCKWFADCFSAKECHGGSCSGVGLNMCNCGACISFVKCTSDRDCGGLRGACDLRRKECDCDYGFRNIGEGDVWEGRSRVCLKTKCSSDSSVSCYGLPCTSGSCACWGIE